RTQSVQWHERLFTISVTLAITVCLAGTSVLAQRGPGPRRQGPPPAATPAPAAAPAPAAEAKQPPLRITVNDEGVSVFAVNVNAHELLTTLAAKTGIRLIVDYTIDQGRSAPRTITVNLRNREVQDIIDHIVAAYGLSCRAVDGVCMISEGIPRHASSYLLSDIDSITTQYVVARNAKGLLPVFLQDHVKTNVAQNAVVLSAPSQVLEKFRDDIAQFDVPAAQIMIDVLVVEFTNIDRDEFDFAIDWSNAGKSASVLSATGDIGFTSVTDLPPDFSIRLKALIEKQKARVRANPRIATVSGNEASVFVGVQQYLSTPIESESRRSSNLIDAGVKLEITPWTGGEGEIIVDVEPEISTLSAPDPRTGLPDKSTRTAETVVRVKDGETIIIGGLLQDELRETRSKVPVLGDLPLVGRLFRRKRIVQTHTDLFVFITPTILSQTGHLPEEQEAEIKRRFLGPEQGDDGE
ncbi:MAG: type II secretion system protein GspD, partial [Armatimonadota bacterium]